MDNIDVAPSSSGTSVPVATDEIGNVHYPIYKISYGADGSQTPVDATNPLPIGFPTDGPNFDAFARLRVSNPETIFDSKQIHDKQPLFWDEAVTGAAAGTWSQNTASTVMDVDLNTAESITRQTFRRFNYQPGKSQLILITFVLDHSGGGTGITREVGIHDDNNGVFLQDSAGTINLAIRSNVTGSPVDTVISQASWNIDAMDGTGTSGITMDWTKSQIMLIDMEWLGVGRVRVGFVVDGIPYYVHQFVHANVLSGVYMSTPNLPIRFYIDNDGTGAASTLEHVCCSVISEGGTQEVGTTRAKYTAAITTLQNTAIYAILGIKLKAANIDASIDVKKISIIASSTNDKCQWILIWNPTIAGTFTYANETDSSVMTATGAAANTVTNGYVIDSGYFDTSSPVEEQVESALKLGSSIAGVVDEVVLCVKPITNNITVYGSMTWREIS